MPCVASSTRRLMPLLLASVLLSSATLPSSAWASCAPDRGQEQPQDAGPAVQAQEAQPPTAPVAAPDSDADAAMVVAQRIHATLATGHALDCQVSIGLTSWTGPHETLDAMLSRADAALYRAKNEGRNRTCVD